MKRIANIGDVIEYIHEDCSILASVGFVDHEEHQYGIYVTSEYSFRCSNIAQDYVYFKDVIAIYKKIAGVEPMEDTPKIIWSGNGKKSITDWRNLC